MKLCERKQSSPNLGNYCDIHVKTVRATTQNVSLYSPCSRQELKQTQKLKRQKRHILNPIVPVKQEQIQQHCLCLNPEIRILAKEHDILTISVGF